MRLSMSTLPGLFLGIAFGTAGCTHVEPRLYAPLQPDGWSAQPVAITCRFAPDADVDPATRAPVGDEGYYFYVLTKAAEWDYRTMGSYFRTHARQRWGHCWLMLESPETRLECGINGNFGRERPTYGQGLVRKFSNGDPDPVSYLWETMSDGQIEIGNGGRTPTFVWRMPITQRRYELIFRYLAQREYGKIDVRANNCVDMVSETAARAGIHLIHRIRLTLPPETRILWKTFRLWTAPEFRILEYSTPDLLEVDLRHLARLGIGHEVTDWYLASDLTAPTPGNRGKKGNRTADGAW